MAWHLASLTVMLLALLSASAFAAPDQPVAGTPVAGTPVADTVDPRQVEQGAYLARVGDCAACHTAPKGLPLAGGLPMATPFGTIYSTNITPDKAHGIGKFSFDDFDRAMRTGITEDGEHLYPAMPYPSFAKLSSSDMHALYAYFMRGVKPAPTENRESELRWPLSIRSLMAVWNRLYLKKGEYVADARRSASWNRGAYLVQGLGHCGACHTLRGIAGQEKALSETDGKHYLTGAVADNWFASNLTDDPGIGLHAWSKQDIVDYLKTGRTARSAASGAMAHVVGASTQHLHDDDLMAIAEYLKSLPASHNVTATGNAASNNATSGNLTASDNIYAPASAVANTTTRALRSGKIDSRGAQLYLDNCNACHHSDGTGVQRTFPSLVKNEVVDTKDPTSLIHIVLTGSALPSTQVAPSALAMPDFAWRLNDRDVADVLSFVRSSWGNQAPPVNASEVARLRKATKR